MSKIKYYYDTETCKYERIKVKKRDVVINALGFLSLALVLSVGIIVVLGQYFDSPKEAALKEENNELKLYYDLMKDQVDGMDAMLGVLQEKDDNVYRVVFEAEPIPETVREAGSGGALRYRQLLESDMENKNLVVSALEKIDNVKKKMYIQTKSYDEVMALALDKERLYSSMPAIQPVSNKDLRRFSSGFGYRTDPIFKECITEVISLQSKAPLFMLLVMVLFLKPHLVPLAMVSISLSITVLATKHSMAT